MLKFMELSTNLFFVSLKQNEILRLTLFVPPMTLFVPPSFLHCQHWIVYLGEKLVDDNHQLDGFLEVVSLLTTTSKVLVYYKF